MRTIFCSPSRHESFELLPSRYFPRSSESITAPSARDLPEMAPTDFWIVLINCVSTNSLSNCRKGSRLQLTKSVEKQVPPASPMFSVAKWLRVTSRHVASRLTTRERSLYFGVQGRCPWSRRRFGLRGNFGRFERPLNSIEIIHSAKYLYRRALFSAGELEKRERQREREMKRERDWEARVDSVEGRRERKGRKKGKRGSYSSRVQIYEPTDDHLETPSSSSLNRERGIVRAAILLRSRLSTIS